MRKYYGKTSKQWKRLYKQYSSTLTGVRHLSPAEFKKAYYENGSIAGVKAAETGIDYKGILASYAQKWYEAKAKGRSLRPLRTEGEVYTAISDRTNQFRLSKKTSRLKKIIATQKRDVFLKTLPQDLLEDTAYASQKQADAWAWMASSDPRFAGRLDITAEDFLKQDAKADAFWDYVDEQGGFRYLYGYTKVAEDVSYDPSYHQSRYGHETGVRKKKK
jgi:hypothetical protein